MRNSNKQCDSETISPLRLTKQRKLITEMKSFDTEGHQHTRQTADVQHGKKTCAQFLRAAHTSGKCHCLVLRLLTVVLFLECIVKLTEEGAWVVLLFAPLQLNTHMDFGDLLNE